MKNEIKKQFFFRIMDVIMIVYAMAMLKKRIKAAVIAYHDFSSWGLTEFLINYEGGYVRRGLFGEILYMLNKLFPGFDPRLFIIILCSVSFLIFSGFILKKFKEHDFCWWILPLNVCLLGSFSIVRKDYMCMLFALLILYAFNRITAWRTRYIIVSLLSILVLNLHECSFFLIGCFVLLLMLKDKGSIWGWKLIGIVSLIAGMGLVCVCKGDKEVAQQIWNSWGCFHNHFVNTQPEASIGAIGWDSAQAVQFHLSTNFLTPVLGIRCWFSKPIIWCMILFVIPNIMFMRKGWENNRYSDDTKRLLSIMLMQFVALLPMFTILSCDGSRICFYWTMSSMLIYFIVPRDKCTDIIPRQVKAVAEKLQTMVYFKHSTKLAIFLMMFLSISNVTPNLYGGFFLNSVVGVYFVIIQQIISLLSSATTTIL